MTKLDNNKTSNKKTKPTLDKGGKKTITPKATNKTKPKIDKDIFNSANWNEEISHSDDHLLICLELLCKMYDRPMSTTALIAGLPLENSRLTPDLFIRAAGKAALSAKAVNKKLDDIDDLTLPCVLILKGNKACLLTKADKEAGVYEIVVPESGAGKIKIKTKELEMLYEGAAIFVKPMYKYDKRSSGISVKKEKSWFWGTLSKFWPIYSQVAVAAVLINMFAVATSLFSMNVYDRVVPNNATDTLMVLTIGIFIIFLFDTVLKMLRVYFLDMAGKSADIILGSRIFEHVMGLKLSAKPPSSGGFANELREYEQLREFFSSATMVAFVDIPFVFVFLGVIWIISPQMVFVPIFFIPFVLISSYFAQKPLRQWVAKSFRENSQRHALLVEAINGIEAIKTFGAENKMQRNWESFVSQSAETGRRTRFISSLVSTSAGFFQQLSYVTVIVVGVYFIGQNELTMGGLIAISILNSRTLAPLSQAVNLLVRYNQSMTSLEALNKILALPVERPDDVRFLSIPNIKGNIEFKDITFKYPGQDILALDNVSLKIDAGERVGLIGKIGSGKSTLEKLLMDLYGADKGTILVDGIDIRQIDPSDLRKNIGYVPQDIYHFFGTVRENILLGDIDVSDEELIKAAEISGVMDFVKRHPKGFDMPIGEGGTNLSGGQRQAIAIARAIIKDPPVYVFDEPTAMMDQNSEAKFLNRIAPYLKGKTVMLVTHRGSLLRLVDRLVIMDDSKLIADGPKDQVIEAITNQQIRGA